MDKFIDRYFIRLLALAGIACCALLLMPFLYDLFYGMKVDADEPKEPMTVQYVRVRIAQPVYAIDTSHALCFAIFDSGNIYNRAITYIPCTDEIKAVAVQLKP